MGSEDSHKARLVAVTCDRREGVNQPLLWRIAVVGKGGQPALYAGWSDAVFPTYSSCCKAIRYIESGGGSYKDWLEKRYKPRSVNSS